MTILDLLFPKTCLGCGRTGQYICPACIAKVPRPRPVCPVCFKPSIDGITHSKCNSPLSLNGLFSFWDYEGVIREAFLALKYKFAYEIVGEIVSCSSLLVAQVPIAAFKRTPDLQSGDELNADLERSDKKLAFVERKRKSGAALAEGASSAYMSSSSKGNTTQTSGEDVIKKAIMIPVPLHPRRFNWRGFNQTEEIGKRLAEVAGWTFEANLVVKKINTTTQTGLDRRDRLKNLRGSFGIAKEIGAREVVVFDDVWTTGSTIKEICKVLKRNGARRVWGLTLCRR